ncbi:MAG TPA: hypothetical protein PKZ92_03800 [Candidatus Woesebacteria bacterium]|jgi:hypothetical protein|nr:hypothetical protein [Candidatus Shapirobacteria bacterium]HOR02352.1 hypothetical protein [Candidatus Woesebacteria bacterium]
MTQFVNILFFIFSSLTAYLLSISPISNFVPQIIALSSIVLIIVSLRHRQFSLHLIAFIISLIVFHTQGLNSPFFFLIYFLLFTLAFQNPPTTTLTYSLVLILLLAQSLNSLSSLIPLISLLLITPLSWFIGKQYLDKTKTDTDLSVSETDILLWLSLKFKTGICQIIDTASEVLSTPLTPTQKNHLKYIKDSAKSLLNSSQKLKNSVDRQSDET